MTGRIHHEHPFLPPEPERDPARRLRGRLAAGVTVLTSGEPALPAGLTVSSLMISEGDPPVVVVVVGEEADLLDRTRSTGALVLHVLANTDQPIADRFAGLRPAPGGVFAGLEIEQTPWGPRLAVAGTWAGCRYLSDSPAGYQRLLLGTIEQVTLSDLTDPLVHFRGRYRRLG